MPSCIIVNRVSAVDQKDGYSLSAQSRHSNEYAVTKGFKLLQEFTFQESASKITEQRQFDQILKFIAKYTQSSQAPLHIVVEKKDRWGRLHSRKEFIQQRVLAGQLVVHYYREKQVFDKTCSPEDIFMDDVVTSMNKYVALNIGREAKKGMKEKARQGWYPHKPPPGYLNHPDRASETPIVVNEGERDFVHRIFALRGNEGLSYQGIVDTMVSEGTVPTHRRPIFRRSFVEKVLKNNFYGGIFSWAGEDCQGKHELIISPALYRRVQESFQQTGTFADQKRHGVFADFLRCGTDGCGCKITFQNKIKPSGRVYHLYSCANGKKVHKSLAGQYIREEQIMEQFEPALNVISITPNFASEVREAIRQNYAALMTKMKKEEASYLEGITDTEQAEDSLYSDLKRGLIDEVMYTRQVQRVRTERRKLTHLLFELQHSMTDSVFKACDSILELATDAELQWKVKSAKERVEFLKRLLWNPRVTGQTIEYEWRKPFAVLLRMKQEVEWGG